MNITNLLSEEIQKFVSSNYKEDIKKLTLKNASKFNSWIPITYQLIGKKKAEYKLPLWFATENILYPKKVSIEQSSSEITAKYKANLVSGNSLIDLTGGFGVDDYYFSKKFNSVYHCEINTELSDIAKHNFNLLGVTNIECINQDSVEFLQSNTTQWDWIYVDPSRRDAIKRKVFLLEECIPNVVDELDMYFSKSQNVLLKTSPFLDLKSGIERLKHIKKIHIVAVQNEVKELLWELDQNYTGAIEIKSVNICSEKSLSFSYIWDEKIETPITYSHPQVYLYEPNAAIMKSGGFAALHEKYKTPKLNPNSHLFTSDELIEFPGRKFEIISTLPYKKKDIKGHIFQKKLNISTRNFPESTSFLKTKWGIKDGGDLYCFFTTNMDDEKIIVIGKKA